MVDINKMQVKRKPHIFQHFFLYSLFISIILSQWSMHRKSLMHAWNATLLFEPSLVLYHT